MAFSNGNLRNVSSRVETPRAAAYLRRLIFQLTSSVCEKDVKSVGVEWKIDIDNAVLTIHWDREMT